ncbi:MAG: hypothetical protein E7614_03050 [Ruminococcaceae bacterium]|nr:hypothetical protein [Oscillospiraceae bacterium]
MFNKLNFKIFTLFIVSVLLLSSCIEDDGTESSGKFSMDPFSQEVSVESEEASDVVSEESVSDNESDFSKDENVSENEFTSEDEESLDEVSVETSNGETASNKLQLCVPDDEYMNFEYKEVTFDGTIDGIINELAKEKLFSEDVKVNSFEIEGDTIRIDLSAEFGFAIATGTLAERMILGSFVNTLVLYYDVKQVYFTVDGDFFDSGHVYYDFPLSFTEALG